MRTRVLALQSAGFTKKLARSWIDRSQADLARRWTNLPRSQQRRFVAWGFLPPTAMRFQITESNRFLFISEREYAYAHPLNGKYGKWVRDRISTRAIFTPFVSHFEPLDYQLLCRDGQLLILPLTPRASEHPPTVEGLVRYLRRYGPAELVPSTWRGTGNVSLEAKNGQLLINGLSYAQGEAHRQLERMVQRQFYVVIPASAAAAPGPKLRIVVANPTGSSPRVVEAQLVEDLPESCTSLACTVPVGTPVETQRHSPKPVEEMLVEEHLDRQYAHEEHTENSPEWDQEFSPQRKAGQRVRQLHVESGRPGPARTLKGRQLLQFRCPQDPRPPAGWNETVTLLEDMCRFAPQLSFVEFIVKPGPRPLIVGTSPIPAYGRIFPFRPQTTALLKQHIEQKQREHRNLWKRQKRLRHHLKLRIRRRFAAATYPPGLVPYQSVRWFGDLRRDLTQPNGVPITKKLWAHRNGYLSHRLEQYGITTGKPAAVITDLEYRWLRHPNRKYKYWLEDKISLKYVAVKHRDCLPDYYYHTQGAHKPPLKMMDLPGGYPATTAGILSLIKTLGTVALKPDEGSHGEGFCRLDWDGKNYRINGKTVTEAHVRDKLAGNYLVTEFITSHPELSRLYPNSVNTLRLIVFKKDGINPQIGNAYLRVGCANSGYVDNTAAGGLMAEVDVATGRYGNAQALVRGRIQPSPFHPDTGEHISGQLPHWQTVTRKVLDIARDLPQLEYLGFDVAITPTGIKLPEINRFPDYPRINRLTPETNDYLLYKVEQKKRALGVGERRRTIMSLADRQSTQAALVRGKDSAGKLIAARMAQAALQASYQALRVLPVQKQKVLLLSRQSNRSTLDLRILQRALRDHIAAVRVVTITRRIGTTPWQRMLFALALARSLYHLATSQIVVADSYWPAISAVQLRPETSVYQMWHSLGKIKQSGLVTAGKKAGRSRKISDALRMHAGYNFVLAGAPAWNRFYRDSFGIGEEKILNIGLPRSDYLHARRHRRQDRQPHQKKIILYAPTFRRAGTISCASMARQLSRALDPELFHLVVRCHSNTRGNLGPDSKHEEPTLRLLTKVDLLITDYSAIAVEAAILDLPTLYYVPDIEHYRETNGLNLDLHREMPGCVFTDAAKLAEAAAKPYPYEKLAQYRKKWLLPHLGSATADLVAHIAEQGGWE